MIRFSSISCYVQIQEKEKKISENQLESKTVFILDNPFFFLHLKNRIISFGRIFYFLPQIH